MIYEDSRISLVTIPLTFLFDILVWFYQWTQGYPFSSFWPTRQRRAWTPSHGVGHKLYKSFIGHSHMFCATFIPVPSAGKTDFRFYEESVVVGLGLGFCFSVAGRVPSHIKKTGK